MNFNFLVNLDLYVFHIVNNWAGTKIFDYLVLYEESEAADLVKGALFLTFLWYFWFKEGPGQAGRREKITAIFIGVILTLFVCRLIADLAPFRNRPMYTSGIGYRNPGIKIEPNMVNWSSFPSDQAGYFLALAAGIFLLSRPLGVVLISYTVVFICIPRIYLGVHYPGDTLVGALIGIIAVAIAANSRTIRERIAAPINRMEKLRPAVFYAGFFLVSFEMASLFDHIRDTVRLILHLVHAV